MWRLLFLLSAVSAAEPTLIPPNGILGSCNFITGEMHFDCIPLYVGYLVQVLFAGLGGACIIQVIYAGYEYALSGVIEDKQAGKRRLTWALLGLLISVMSYMILDFFVSGLQS